MIAVMCSCSSEEDNGVDIPNDVNKRIKSIHMTNSHSADFSYSGDKISKITIKSLTDWDYGSTMVMSFEYQTDKVIETVTNDFYQDGMNYTNTYNIENGLTKSIYMDGSLIGRYEYSSGLLTKVDDELTYSYDKNGSMIASSTFGNITLSKYENKQQMWLLWIYDMNARNLRYYLGVFGKPTKYLPERAGSTTFAYSFDSDGYVKEIKIDEGGGYNWTETYTYETIQ